MTPPTDEELRAIMRRVARYRLSENEIEGLRAVANAMLERAAGECGTISRRELDLAAGNSVSPWVQFERSSGVGMCERAIRKGKSHG